MKPSHCLIALLISSHAAIGSSLPGPRKASGTPASTPSPGRFEFTQVHMGLPVRIVLHASGEHAARLAAGAAFERIAALDRSMSDYRPDSDVQRLARLPGQQVTVSRELVTVLQMAIHIARATGGAFDPTVGPFVQLWREARRTGTLPAPDALADARSRVGWRLVELDAARSTICLRRPGMALDLGGIAKGYILQEALRTLRMRGVSRALVESGGDIVVGDAPPGRTGWRIRTAGADAAFAERASRLVNAALSSSGASAQYVDIGGRRYSHIVDPRTGLGVTSSWLARVIDGDAGTADALATALTILGPESVPVLLGRFPGGMIDIQLPTSNLQLPNWVTPNRLTW